MLTPRRTLMLLAGFLIFGAGYAVYARALGWLDGLPQLPDAMLVHGEGEFRPPVLNESPTQVRLTDAFGPKAPETDYAYYPNQFSFVQGDSIVVLASGPVPSNPNSHRVTLSPFSLAVFSKPRPLHVRLAGEVPEITTIHADKAVLEFDQKLRSANDMKTAKLLRLELVSDFAQTFDDPRRGTIQITNNQRTADRSRHLTIRTAGPMFYRDAKATAGTPAAQGPDLWTDAPLEIVDRQNLPRAIGADPPVAAATKSADARVPTAVADIIAARRAPPPTVTAIGMRVYLDPPPAPGQPKPKKSNSGGPLDGVRRIELLERVLVHLWIDNGTSPIGAPAPAGAPAPSPSNQLALTPPPAAMAALTGNVGTGAYTARLLNRALLQIETRGPFAYDAEKGVARFDVVPHSDPSLPNDVQVTKVPARGGTSALYSQVLELEMNGGATGASRPANAPAFKRLHAWTYTAGRYLTITSQDDATEAYGQDLSHEQATGRTALTGSPLYVVQSRNVLAAGAPQRPATLSSEPGPGPDRKAVTTVRGPGRVERIDAATNAPTFTASWETSLVQSREVINGREQDLFTFTDRAAFEDVKADYWLKGDVLKLWLEGGGDRGPQVADANPAQGGQARPSRLTAIGQVTSHSTDYDIDETELLNVFFSEPKGGGPVVPVPARPAPTPVPAVAPKIAAAPPLTPPTQVAVPKEQEKGKPPYKLRARTINAWLTRVPAPPRAETPKADEPAMKYQFDRARCEDNVSVHQDPVDRTKPRGTDVLGRLLLIDGSADGSKLTVYGWPNRPGELHQEDMSLIGPDIELDQVHNTARVKGRGALTLPTGSDFAGGELAQSEVVVIHWRDSMTFQGAKKSAEFVGKVSARQGESWVLCHTLSVKFDRPIYFNSEKRAALAPKPINPNDPKGSKKEEPKPRIDTVNCYPAAADSADDKKELYVTYNEVAFDKSGKMIRSQQLSAQELKMEAQAREGPGGEPFQRVTADGPGVLRVWQPGDKEPGPAPKDPTPKTTTPAPKGDDTEMRLTVVTFRGRMVAVDKGKVLQKATFETSVEAVSVPAESPTLELQRHRLPAGAMMLKCDKELIVWTHRKPNGPPAQRLDAYGNAYLRTDEHEGWGESISNDGKVSVLSGSDAIAARIANRFNRGTDYTGKKIVYDRGSGSIKVIESFGGTLGK
ncbi:MAG: hypothetical protein FJ304_04125 [Planctomycetes bacterium]|nr:hypothetical protein [Planctomycetota bacterium]